MSLSAKVRRAPGRIVTGLFILDQGISKLTSQDEEKAKQLHGGAVGAYPVVNRMQPKPFMKSLGAAEVAVGAALLLPIVPAGVAGVALVGFSGALVGLWWRTPGMHEEGNPRPTPQGTAMAKDSWMLGIGAGLVLDQVLESVTGRPARKAAKKVRAAKAEVKEAQAEAKEAQAEAKAAMKAAAGRKHDAKASTGEVSATAKKLQAETATAAREVMAAGKERKADVASLARDLAASAKERTSDTALPDTVRQWQDDTTAKVRKLSRRKRRQVRAAAKVAAKKATIAQKAAKSAAKSAVAPIKS